MCLRACVCIRVSVYAYMYVHVRIKLLVIQFLTEEIFFFFFLFHNSMHWPESIQKIHYHTFSINLLTCHVAQIFSYLDIFCPFPTPRKTLSPSFVRCIAWYSGRAWWPIHLHTTKVYRRHKDSSTKLSKSWFEVARSALTHNIKMILTTTWKPTV